MNGYPLGYPLASNTGEQSPLMEHGIRSLGSGNSGAPRGTTTQTKPSAQRRISATGIETIADQLSDRDRAILRSVHDHRFLTVTQIRTLLFADLAPTSARRTAKRVLARLRRLRILGSLSQQIGGVRAGSQGLVHYVDVVGDRILHHRSGRRAHRVYEPSARFVHHRLAVADAHVALIAADRHGAFELIDSAVEPATRRGFTGLGSARRTLKPDVYAETAARGDDGMVRAWFIEIDRGTEHLTTLLRKCREYEAYRQSGVEQDRHGSFPVVIWSMSHTDAATAERRRRQLAQAIAADPRLPNALFRIIAPDELLPLIERGGER